jgi:hypothetical protein
MRLIWRSGTRYHDWTNREQPRRLIKIATAVGALGAADWLEVGAATGRLRVNISADDLPGELFGRLEAHGGAIVSAGGIEPQPWELFLLLKPWDATRQRVHGANLATFRFGGRPFTDRDGSDRLFAAFLTAHSPATTEFGFIHPYEHFVALDETYRPPLINSPMISGAFWATFFGPGHISEFDRRRLHEIRAFETSWTGDDGLFLRATPTVEDVTSPEGELRLRRLTDQLRGALKS